MSGAELLARIDERVNSLIDKTDLIYGEVKKTNGRVTALETWKSKVIGSWKTVLILGAIVGAVITWITTLIV